MLLMDSETVSYDILLTSANCMKTIQNISQIKQPQQELKRFSSIPYGTSYVTKPAWILKVKVIFFFPLGLKSALQQIKHKYALLPDSPPWKMLFLCCFMLTTL